jgi:hypothetical protein
VKRAIAITVLLITIAVAAGLALFDPSSLISRRQGGNDALIAEKTAAHIGVLAYLYGFPLVDMQRQMHNETHRVADDQQVLAPVNRFYRFPDLVTPETAGNLRAPNSDTLYFTAWFDISEQPLIIHVPDTAGRYYTIAVTNQYAEVTHIGRRTTGTTAGYFALTLPGWDGELPEGVLKLTVETPIGWLLGRMLVDGPEDYPQASGLVNAIWLAELSDFRPGQPPARPAPPAAEPLEPLDSLQFFELLNAALAKLPARDGEAALMAQFDAIGVGPSSDFDVDALDAPARRGLESAVREGRAIVDAATARTIPDYNGWMISSQIGRYGFDYMHRASVARGGYGNLPEESLYPAALFDAQGNLLSGDRRYRLRFPAGQLPPVRGFWSLSAYNLDEQFSLEPNAIDRYSIGDRTSGLVYGDDGSLTILLQHQDPGPGVNWMPVPAGYFSVVMRLYEPEAAALDNSYLLPRIEELGEQGAQAR